MRDGARVVPGRATVVLVRSAGDVADGPGTGRGGVEVAALAGFVGFVGLDDGARVPPTTVAVPPGTVPGTRLDTVCGTVRVGAGAWGLTGGPETGGSGCLVGVGVGVGVAVAVGVGVGSTVVLGLGSGATGGVGGIGGMVGGGSTMVEELVGVGVTDVVGVLLDGAEPETGPRAGAVVDRDDTAAAVGGPGSAADRTAVTAMT